MKCVSPGSLGGLSKEIVNSIIKTKRQRKPDLKASVAGPDPGEFRQMTFAEVVLGNKIKFPQKFTKNKLLKR